MINLSVICPEMAVRVLRVEKKKEFAALYASQEIDEDSPFVFIDNGQEGCDICFNIEKVKQLHAESWLKNRVDYEVLIDGFIIKQIARLRYTVKRDTFDERFQTHIIKIKESPLYYIIYENLFSAMNEYNLCFDFPELARILELLNSAVMFSGTSRLKAFGPGFELFIPYMTALEKLIRYNYVSGEVDISFINFCLPLCLSAKRTNYVNVISASNLIEEWLFEAKSMIVRRAEKAANAGTQKINPPYSKDIKSVTDRELDEIDRNAQGLSVRSKLEDVAKEVGLQAGTGRVKHKTNDTSLFFLDTVRKYHKEISELEYVFKRAFTSMKIVDSFDGDINMNKQQAAYLASITREETKVFQYYRKKKVSVDIVILRDVSGSTHKFEKEYAEGLIEILAAVNSFKGIRTMEIDFGGEVRMNKDFDQTVEMASIFPVSGGGTSLLPAVRFLFRQTFKGKRRLLFILSDGEINDREQADWELDDFCTKNNVNAVKVALGAFANNGYEQIHVRNLHKFIAKKILEQGVTDETE
ncbi:MAG: VWA domain-containing protein [Syntrophomonadaceae bacterium]|jgi:hypothetical protein|nr:VWA domain-containing protein [Syntrophomonadaceae bacterium]